MHESDYTTGKSRQTRERIPLENYIEFFNDFLLFQMMKKWLGCGLQRVMRSGIIFTCTLRCMVGSYHIAKISWDLGLAFQQETQMGF